MIAKKKPANAPVIPGNENANISDQGKFEIIPLKLIRISKTNRKHFDQLKLAELAASIKDMGVAQPILIRPVTPTEAEPEIYEIVAGERRFRASIIAGAETIPAMVRMLTDLQAAKIQILENLQRENPHELEEALGYQNLMFAHGYSADQLVTELKKSRSYIYARLKLCSLAAPLHEPFLDGKIDASTALLLARIPVSDLQVRAYREIITPSFKDEPLSVREAQTHIRNRYMLELSVAPFDIKSNTLTEAPACGKCPKRTGNQPEIFTDINPDLCTDPDCFARKIGASVACKVSEYEKKGIQVFQDRNDFAHILQSARNGSDQYVIAETWITAFPRHHSNSKSKQSIIAVLSEDQLGQPAAYLLSESNKFIPLYDKYNIQDELEKAGYCDNLMQAFDKSVEGGKWHEANRETSPPTESSASTVKVGETELVDKAKSDDAYLKKLEREKANQEHADKENKFRYHFYRKVRQKLTLLENSHVALMVAAFVRLVTTDYAVPDAELAEFYDKPILNEESSHAFLQEHPEASVQYAFDVIIGNNIEVNAWNVNDKEESTSPWPALLIFASQLGIDPVQARKDFENPVDATPIKRPLLTLKKTIHKGSSVGTSDPILSGLTETAGAV